MTQPRLLGDRYELEGVVGRGGMAEVYRARDIRLDRIVAIKTLRADLARDQTFQARFRREAQSAASLNNPSIVAVYDTGEDMSTRRAGPVHRDGVRGRPHSQGPADRGPPAAARARPGDHQRRAARPGVQPPGGHRAPGHQARERDGHPQRRHQGDGLRHRPGDERLPGHDDPDRAGHRHRAVPVAGAGPGRAGGRAQRPVLHRLPDVRAAHRPAAVHRRLAGGDRLPARPGEPDPAVPAGPGHPAVGGRHHPQGHGQVAERPVPDRRGDGGRHPARRLRHAGGRDGPAAHPRRLLRLPRPDPADGTADHDGRGPDRGLPVPADRVRRLRRRGRSSRGAAGHGAGCPG